MRQAAINPSQAKVNFYPHSFQLSQASNMQQAAANKKTKMYF